MSWERTIICIVAVAGAATGTALLYRYATRGLGGESSERSRELPTGSRAANAVSETTMTDDVDEAVALMSDDELANDVQFNHLVVQEGSMLLSLFGVAFMVIVAVVAFLIAMTSQTATSVLQIEMFAPLMFIGMGIVAASMTHTAQYRPVPESVVPPLLAEKSVYPDNETSYTPQPPTPVAASAPVVPAVAPATRSVNAHAASAPVEKPSLEEILAHADELYDQVRFRDLHVYLAENIKHYPTDVELLWRCARSCQDVMPDAPNADAQKNLAFDGLRYAEEAYAANPNHAMSNKWMGIMTSTCGNYLGTSKKIEGAYKIKEFIARAIELNPTDATSHNILGQWCLAFANLSWIEKKAAAAIFGTPPTATYEDAVRHFHDAENISPGFWKKNAYLLGETYYKMSNPVEAKLWLEKARNVPVKTTEDKEVHVEIEKLLKKL
ncbi:regulator of microtubule dynamics protein [Achlya hypogyna]|uniref:Regulator of microtubule dynamics protein 1 n=1 Tax=Achlya hypogyna TaxID=1202772 RepID=A0A1V9ZTS2_ACHHY|nr:regulator of microtubule dynamics protein [Achlya hypogyna]